MIADMDMRTAQALVRFGLGRRGAEPLPSDPAAWLLDQLRRPDPTRLDDPPTTAKGLAALREDRETKPPPGESRTAALFKAQAAAQLANAVTTPAPFRERLVWFWTNHFTISRRQGQMRRRRRRLRRGSDPPPRHRPLRRHGPGGDASSGDAAISGQCQLIRPRQPGRAKDPSRPEREPCARVHGTAHRQSAGGLHPGGCDVVRKNPDRLVGRSERRSARFPLPSLCP